jgi:hypothetical protein
MTVSLLVSLLLPLQVGLQPNAQALMSLSGSDASDVLLLLLLLLPLLLLLLQVCRCRPIRRR